MNEEKARAFGLFISKRRLDRKLSQAALAKAAGISRPYLAQIETGKRMPSDEKFQALLVALGASLEDFMRELLDGEVEAEQLESMAALIRPFDKMQELLTPEQVSEILSVSPSADQLGASIAALGGIPAPSAPDGWTDLSAEDRRLVQRLVNRLSKDSGKPKEADDGDE